MKRQLRFLRALSVLAIPLMVVLAVEEVPRFVFASCSYYSTSCASKTVTATPAIIPVDGSSTLELLNGSCPCSWQIISQPGNWQVQTGGDCTATLMPTSQGWGNPGNIVVQVTDYSYCQKTITVSAGSEMRIEMSTDGGATWAKDNLTISSPPGSTVQFAVRTTMTVAEDETRGWSFSLKDESLAVEAAGGALELLSATHVGTHTEIAKSYSPGTQTGSSPDYRVTDPRSVSGSTVGYVQGVVVDFNCDPGTILVPVIDFVTSGACYSLTMPTTTGVYQAQLLFVDDLGDGRPPVETVLSPESGEIIPNLRGFTLTVNANQSGSGSYCNGSGPWK